MTSIDLHGPYRARAVRFLELWQHGGWEIKVYGIAHDGTVPDKALVHAIEHAAASVLPEPAQTSSRYGLGFACAHQGRTANVAFVDWWQEEDELHQTMFVAAGHGALRRATDSDLTACAWDLALIAFERDAWVDTILRNPAGPDPAAYLSTRMNADV